MRFEEIEVGDVLIHKGDGYTIHLVMKKDSIDRTVKLECYNVDAPNDRGYAWYEETDCEDLIKYGTTVSQGLGDTVKTHGEMVVNTSGGKKQDGGKVDPTILLKDLHNSVQSVIRVLEFGAQKYGRANYSLVENERYEAALSRHWLAHLAGEESDADTGESHLSHLICCALFLLEKEYGNE